MHNETTTTDDMSSRSKLCNDRRHNRAVIVLLCVLLAAVAVMVAFFAFSRESEDVVYARMVYFRGSYYECRDYSGELIVPSSECVRVGTIAKYSPKAVPTEDQESNYYTDGTPIYARPEEEKPSVIFLDVEWGERGEMAALNLIDSGEAKQPLLTMEKLRTLLAGQGEDLTWSDLKPYHSKSVGSGFYILRYVIADSDYYLNIADYNSEAPVISMYCFRSGYFSEIRDMEDLESFLTSAQFAE